MRRLPDVELHAGNLVRILADPGNIVRVNAAGCCERRVGEAADFIGDCHIFAQLDIPAPRHGRKRTVQTHVKFFELADGMNRCCPPSSCRTSCPDHCRKKTGAADYASRSACEDQTNHADVSSSAACAAQPARQATARRFPQA